jgi:hypothetical protein
MCQIILKARLTKIQMNGSIGLKKLLKKNIYNIMITNNFSDIRKVGTGGFGTVFRANLENSEQQFALKSFKLKQYI